MKKQDTTWIWSHFHEDLCVVLGGTGVVPLESLKGYARAQAVRCNAIRLRCIPCTEDIPNVSRAENYKAGCGGADHLMSRHITLIAGTAALATTMEI